MASKLSFIATFTVAISFLNSGSSGKRMSLDRGFDQQWGASLRKSRPSIQVFLFINVFTVSCVYCEAYSAGFNFVPMYLH